MSFPVKLYKFKKRDNSTKRPSGTGTEGPHVFNCVLKHGSGILHPTISLDLGKTTAPTDYNYAYIPEFQRYYFIEEWYFDEALWTASLKVDVLATYKSEIGSANLYVMRCSHEHDGDIIDTLYPAKSGCDFESSVKTNPWGNNETYVIGVVSQDATCGSLVHYALGRASFTTICSWLLSDVVTETNGFSLDDASLELQRSLVEPLQFIKSCVLLPVSISDTISSVSPNPHVVVYGWETTEGGKVLDENTAIVKTYKFAIHKHPDTSSRGNYVNSAPFTAITLTIPPFGTFDIDTSVTCNAPNDSGENAPVVTATIRIDQITGKGTLTIMCNGIVLNRIEAQIGIPISMSSVIRDYLGAVSNVGGAISGMADGFLSGGLAGGVVGGLSGIGNAIKSLQARANTIGTTGSYGALLGDFRLDHQFFRPISDDNTHNGRPLCAKRVLNTVPGYIIVQDGDVSINGTSTEDSQIRQYLETGFYYE